MTQHPTKEEIAELVVRCALLPITPEMLDILQRLEPMRDEAERAKANLETGITNWRMMRDEADEAIAERDALRERMKDLELVLLRLVEDVENKWGDPHTLVDARAALAKDDK